MRFETAPQAKQILAIITAQLAVFVCFPSATIADDSSGKSWCLRRNKTPVVDCSRDTSPPEITVYAADKAGSFYSDDFTIRGTINSPCLASAGIYEAETEVSQIAVVKNGTVTSQDFEVTIDASQEPEIRAISLSGRAQVLKIDVLDIRG